MSVRVCENELCTNHLTGRQERFCGRQCRFEQWDREHPRTPASVPCNGLRRPSRDGKGTRLYVTAPEAIELFGGRVPESVSTKAMRALERIAS